MKDKLKKWAVGFCVALGALFVASAPALAADDPAPKVEFATTDMSTFVIAAPIVTLVLSILIPLINGLITTNKTASWVKGAITIVLNAVAALFTNGLLADGSSAFSANTLYTAIAGALVSFFTYANIYRPLSLTSTPQTTRAGGVVDGKLANVGLH
jgi:uncharacterized membrane protein YvlD (DUF360 family)